jgi:hypothetical protein
VGSLFSTGWCTNPQEKKEEDEAVGFRGGGAGGACSTSWGEARGVPRSSSATERDTWERGRSHGLAERDPCDGVFGISRHDIFCPKRNSSCGGPVQS